MGEGREARGKLEALRTLLGRLPPAVAAFSGGADSAFLAVVAKEAMGDRVSVAIADSPSLPRRELHEAVAFATRHGFDLDVLPTRELEDPRYRRNESDRCGFCKEALLDSIMAAPELADRVVLLGVNTDDLGEHRPGQEVARGRGARFPLVDAGLSKAEIRALSRDLGIETWDKPAAACLASRIAYGVPVTRAALARVERAEEGLRELGISGDVRVRDQGGDLARIEVAPAWFDLVMARRSEIAGLVKGAGFRFVTLDLEGFRSGSHNFVLLALERPGA